MLILSSIPLSSIALSNTSNTVIICSPDPCRGIASQAHEENPQGDKYHVIRGSDDLLKSTTKYNDESKLRGYHKQEPKLSGDADWVDSIFDVSADSKQNEEYHHTVKD